MSWLLVDIGNTRVKWARLADGQMGKLHAAAIEGWKVEDCARKVFGAGGGAGLIVGARARVGRGPRVGGPNSRGRGKGNGRGVERIIVSSVAGPRLERMMIAAARRAGVPAPQFVVSQRSAAGVTTSYLEPWRLGVDRFVGAIGAHHLAQGSAVCVVNMGTAMTIDLVDGRGLHRGGAIIPGPALMVDSLLKYTNGIRRRAQGGANGIQSLFARTTRTAIGQGSRYAAAAAIDRAVEEARQELGTQPLVLLTGGGAAAVKPLIRTACIGVPDLVLHGLAVWGLNTPSLAT